MSSSHADTCICRTRTENDIFVSRPHFYDFLDSLDAGNPVGAAVWFLENYKKRRSVMACSSQIPYLRLSVILSETPEGLYKPNFLEKGVQLWLCMEDKLSKLQEAEESENLFQMLEEMCHEAVAELATDSELRIRKHQDDDAGTLYKTENDKEYYNNGRKKGYLLILNSIKNREGTEKDVANIMKFFQGKLRFEVDDPRSMEKADLSTEKFKEYLKQTQNKLKSASVSEYYCFVCMILSHGNEDGIATTNGIIAVEDIQKMFSNDKVQRFAGKPKLFFIQACRGSKGEGYVTAGEKADNIQEADDIQEDEADEIIKIPHEADTLVAYATAKGKLAIRCVKNGTWFIYEIIKEFEKNYTRDHVEEMLITVRQRVASIYSKKYDCMQMPCVQSTLTRRIKFD